MVLRSVNTALSSGEVGNAYKTIAKAHEQFAEVAELTGVELPEFAGSK